MKTFKQVLLIILDGWGYTEDTHYNAIKQAPASYMDHLWQTYPHALFEASGEAVGLPKDNIGTSEIGHLTIGAGKIIYTDMLRVSKDIENNTFQNNSELKELFEHTKKNNSTLHLMGLVSPGGVHSHQEHLFAIIRAAKNAGLTKVAVHVITDGRDLPPRSANQYVEQLEDVLKETGVGRIASISGRYYAMDRDTNWDRTQKEADALFEGKGQIFQNKDAKSVIEEQYTKNITDEFIEPCILPNAEGKADTISQNDGVLFFNFRPDRARQISTFIAKKATKMNLYFATLAQYDKNIPSHVLYPPLEVKTTIAEEVSKVGLTQVHIAETEKYAHVTYFLNGGKEKEHENETFVLIDSRKDIPTHDLAPHMKAEEIANKAIEYIEKGTNFIAINFANADMVGHTGKWEPALEAIRFEDQQIKRVVEAILAKGGVAFITADHGNAEVMFDETTNQPVTAHTLNKVPGILTMQDVKLNPGGLSDVAPTVLSLFGIEKPASMTGKNLIEW